ncbi:MAG: di-trans,poly-cis-decaprenylcistransferase [Gammaproteobacteria bacterium]|nr:di-trans,poly-cis-decaprenylcistransferase [Gammaproteobacteria bacterium]
MDGNGRWAADRGLPRVSGHVAGVYALRRTVASCLHHRIPTLTVFAFSSENWRRPLAEVSALQKLFLRSLKKEIAELHRLGVRMQFIGDFSRLTVGMQHEMKKAEALTSNNQQLTFVLAFNYGGRWDILQASKRMAEDVVQQKVMLHEIDEQQFSQYLALADLPQPDLFIRTSGECRVSNFLLWQIAYAELYFCDVLWPDFCEKDFECALNAFAKRDRRFGSVTQDKS